MNRAINTRIIVRHTKPLNESEESRGRSKFAHNRSNFVHNLRGRFFLGKARAKKRTPQTPSIALLQHTAAVRPQPMQFQHARMLLELSILEISVALFTVLCLWLLARRRQALASFPKVVPGIPAAGLVAAGRGTYRTAQETNKQTCALTNIWAMQVSPNFHNPTT